MCGDCFVCIYLVCQCDGLELGRRNRRITVRGVAVRINKLASFKKSIKREASSYSTLKDERYFDKFQRDLFITVKSHDVSEILDPNFTPGPSPE